MLSSSLRSRVAYVTRLTTTTRTIKSMLPKRLILVRHAESQGNLDEEAYEQTPDHHITLTDNGKDQAQELGMHLRKIIKDEPLLVYCSPYKRTKQTLNYIMKSFTDSHIHDCREEPRLAEQQFGNFQRNVSMKRFKNDRGQFGRFHYSFPEGESGLDVYSRVSGFIASLFRDWTRFHQDELGEMNVIIITHGITLRLFLMRWFHYTVEEFENSKNPNNCAYVMLTRHTRNKRVQFEISKEGLKVCRYPDMSHYASQSGRQHLEDFLKDGA
mmetsp:Transcript_16608/g.27721  ORF Transcript_16608/g.27721 Transcript_16608/m.27721 type:complete len:270 (-) Transcript_16608:198-1007(-)